MKTQKNKATMTRLISGLLFASALILTVSACMDEVVKPTSHVSADQPPGKKFDILVDPEDVEQKDTAKQDGLPFVLESFANYLMDDADCTQNPVGITALEPYVLAIANDTGEENAITIDNFADIDHTLKATLRNNTIVIPQQVFTVGDWRYRVLGHGRISYETVSFEYKLDAVGPTCKEIMACQVYGDRL